VREETVGQKEIGGRFHFVLQPVANPQNNEKVSSNDGEIKQAEVH
jgi:hypothetical protein